MTRVLVTGDREWADRALMEEAFAKFVKHGDVIIHGACRGADLMADEIARSQGLEVEAYPAKWKDDGGKYRPWAGPERNSLMLEKGVDLVLAFHHDLTKSKGTKDMVKKAVKAKVSVVTFPSQPIENL